MARVLVDASRLMVEGLVRAGADIYVGYPITPANWIYAYATERFPRALAAPDEITTLQWMSGFSAVGLLPVTATAFPGFALMVESLGMAFMMELPMVIVLAQRMGPSTGTATLGAQGDLLALRGVISGGFPLPTLAPSDFLSAYTLAGLALHTAVRLRSPVVLLTSKEMVMTEKAFDLDQLPDIQPVERAFYTGEEPYRPYARTSELVPPFLPVGDDRHQVRLTASTHNEEGILQHSSPEAMANTRRLYEKLLHHLPAYTRYVYEPHPEARDVLVAWGVTAEAAREARDLLISRGHPVSLFIPQTLLPVPPVYGEILSRYERVFVAEENLTGQFQELLAAAFRGLNLVGIHRIGGLLSPAEIAGEVAA